MAKATGLAKGANKGHITEKIDKVPRPSHRKGVSKFHYYAFRDMVIYKDRLYDVIARNTYVVYVELSASEIFTDIRLQETTANVFVSILFQTFLLMYILTIIPSFYAIYLLFVIRRRLASVLPWSRILYVK